LLDEEGTGIIPRGVGKKEKASKGTTKKKRDQPWSRLDVGGHHRNAGVGKKKSFQSNGNKAKRKVQESAPHKKKGEEKRKG